MQTKCLFLCSLQREGKAQVLFRFILKNRDGPEHRVGTGQSKQRREGSGGGEKGEKGGSPHLSATLAMWGVCARMCTHV